MLTPPSSGAALARLVHDLANWYQRLEAHLERLEREDSIPPARLQGLRDGLRRCAELGAAAAGGELAPARLPQLLEEFVAEDAAVHAGARCALTLRGLDPRARCQLELTIAAISLENVLLNLVRNARRACETDHPIELRWQLQGQWALVQVVDHGRGMDGATLARCLDMGFSTKEQAGHGLGLSGVKTDVEAAGGRVDIRSQPGQGTTVSLHLPLKGTDQRVVDRSSTARHLPERILVVEDDPEVAEIVQAFLESFGVRSVTAPSGKAAWQALADAEFDAVLVDQGLPDLPGLDLAEGIRQQHPNLVLVLLTGDPAASQLAAGGRAVDGVGVKPLDRALLRALLEDASEHASKRGDAPRQRPAEA